MQFGVATFSVIGDRILGLNDTRRVVTSLAAVAPSLGDLGIGGVFSTDSSSPGAFVIFVLPGGNETSIANGTLVKGCQSRKSYSFYTVTAPFWEGVKEIMAPIGFFTSPVRNLISTMCDSTMSSPLPLVDLLRYLCFG